MREKRTLSAEDKKYFLSLQPDDITLDLLHELFTDTYSRAKKKSIPSRFNTYDEFTLKAGEYFNKTDVLTNCGLFIFNKFLIEPELQDIIGYWNEPVTKKAMDKIQGKLDVALMEDDIGTEPYINYLNKLTWLAFSFNTEVSTSLTYKSMIELPEVKKAKRELMRKYEDDLNSEDNNRATVAATKMEAELVAIAKDVLKDDPSSELYDSGARGAYGVAYKNGQIMKGPVYNQAKHKFDIMYEPIGSGINKENVPTLANSVITSAYSKAIATGVNAYAA